ncbi:unnamed protein product, partial [Closterium sp. Yama58-4]
MHRTRLEFEFQTSLDAPLTRRDFSSHHFALISEVDFFAETFGYHVLCFRTPEGIGAALAVLTALPGPVISCVLGIATSFSHCDVSSCHMQPSRPGGFKVPPLNTICEHCIAAGRPDATVGAPQHRFQPQHVQ